MDDGGDDADEGAAARGEAWKTAYAAEFVRFGLTRGWSAGNAADWASAVEDDAWTYGGRDAAVQAGLDVLACEREDADG